MDARIEKLTREFQDSLKATAEAAVQLQRAQVDIQNTPHYSVVEEFAHNAGVKLSQLVQ